MWISPAYAQAAGGGAGGFDFVSLAPLVLIFVVFYFLLIRPQSKARKEMEARLSKLKAGDEVLLSSGLFAVIDRVDEKDAKVIWLKLGSSIVKARRQAVVALAGEPAPAE